jgi:hypothetical protein
LNIHREHRKHELDFLPALPTQLAVPTDDKAYYGQLCFGRFDALVYLFHAANNAVCEAHFDSMGMSGRMRKNIPHDPFCQLSGALILFLHYPHVCPGFYFSPVFAIHSRLSRIGFSALPRILSFS